MNIKKIVLDNGLTVFLYKDCKKHSTYVNFITKFGGDADTFVTNNKMYRLKNGMAHLLEHLLIENSPYGILMRKLGEMQLNTNGTTYINRTEYYFSGVEKIEEAIPMLIKGINDSHFTEDMVETTKKAIYEEIRMGKDNIYRRLFEMQNKNLFQNISYINGIGSMEDVKSFTYEDVKRCYDTFYTFSNQFLWIAGNFDEENILEIVKKTCKKIHRKTYPFQIVNQKEPNEVRCDRSIDYMPVGKPVVQLSYKVNIEKFTNEEKVALDFYLAFFLKMNFGLESTLNQFLQDEKIIIGGIHRTNLWMKEFVLITLDATTEREEKLVEEINKQMQNPIFDAELFDLYQKDLRIDVGLREESIGNYIDAYIENVFYFDYPYPDTVEQIDSYTFTDFQNKIKELDFSHYTVCKIEDKNYIGIE